MGYSDKIREQFPEVGFTGGSRIHCSLARTAYIKHGRENVRTVMAPLLYSNAGSMIFTFLRSNCQGMDWLVKGPQLAELLQVDFYRHLTKQGDSYTPHKLKNPETGNRFHVIALKGDTIAGIRVWADGCGTGTQVGFRMRLERKAEAEATTRGRTAKAVVDAHAEMSKIMHELQLPPPTTGDVQNAAELLKGLIRADSSAFTEADFDA